MGSMQPGGWRLQSGTKTACKGESTIKSAAAEKLVAAARTAFAVGGVANWPVLFQFLFPHFDAPLRVLTSRIPTPMRRQVPCWRRGCQAAG